MEPGVFLAALLILVGIPAATMLRLARLRAGRQQAMSGDDAARLDALERNVQDLQHQLGETQERLDFAERLLSKPPDHPRPGG